MLNVYEALDTFQRSNKFGDPERQLYYHSEYYHDDVGGYIVVDRDIIYYTTHIELFKCISLFKCFAHKDQP